MTVHGIRGDSRWGSRLDRAPQWEIEPGVDRIEAGAGPWR